MARSDLYRPRVLPELGAVYPMGYLVRLEVNRDDTHTETEWDFAIPRKKQKPSRTHPMVLWSIEQQAIYIPLFKPRTVKKFRGVPKGFEGVADEYDSWRRDNFRNKRPRKGTIMDWGKLPEMEVLGSMLAIRYYSDKHNLGWEPHSHRPAGNKDIVSINKRGKTKWIFIKGPRMRATTWGLKY